LMVVMVDRLLNLINGPVQPGLVGLL